MADETPTVPRLTQTEIRRLAVAASCDPRSLLRVLRGEHVRGTCHDRIVDVLRREGIAPRETVP